MFIDDGRELSGRAHVHAHVHGHAHGDDHDALTNSKFDLQLRSKLIIQG